jgi:tetraacyldisaccharide 4'-kinase
VNVIVHAAGSLYRAINGMRRALYRAGVLRAKKLDRPVISIGNIAAGGAGKTPAVIALAAHLASKGARVAVLTRGYGRAGTDQGAVNTLDAERFGDEPVLIKKKLDNIDVIVGRNRYDNALRYSADLFVLDDGFQHLQLHRDLDIVIDVPGAAFYREDRTALRDADLVIPRDLRLKVPGSLRGRRVFAFSALADNEQFFESLRGAGLTVAGTLGFRDHHRYTPADLDRICEAGQRAGAEAIVTTEKDAIKIDRRDIIPIEAEFVLPPEVLRRAEALLPR